MVRCCAYSVRSPLSQAVAVCLKHTGAADGGAGKCMQVEQQSGLPEDQCSCVHTADSLLAHMR